MNNPWTTDRRRPTSPRNPQRIAVLFPAAGRAVGREPVDPGGDPLGLRHGTVDDLARAAARGGAARRGARRRCGDARSATCTGTATTPNDAECCAA